MMSITHLSELFSTSEIYVQVSSLGAALLLTLIGSFAVGNFLAVGWRTRKNEITSSFSDASKDAYLKHYMNKNPVLASDEFEAEYIRRYGRSTFIFPLLLFIAVLFPLMYLFSLTCLTYVNLDGGQLAYDVVSLKSMKFVATLPKSALAALAGAYLWVVTDLTYQMRRNDFRPSYIILSTIRLVTAIPIAYAFASIGSNSFAPFISFAASAFPVDQMRVIIRRIASKQLGVTIGVGVEKDQITILSGIDSVASDAFQDAGITTVSQLAYCDPIQLSIVTGFKFDYIADMVGQALVFDYLGAKADAIRVLGFRTSVEFRYIIKDAEGDDSHMAPRANMAVSSAASLLGMHRDAFLNVASHISGDPVTSFLFQVWE